MKRLSYLFGVLVIVTMVMSILPMAALAAPPLTIDRDPTLQWGILKSPDRYYDQFVVPSTAPSFEVTSMAIGSDGKTFYVVDANYPNAIAFDHEGALGYFNLYKSTNAGIGWSDKIGRYLYTAYDAYWGAHVNFRIWKVAIAPDDPNFIVAVTSGEGAVMGWDAPVDVWVSANGGITWAETNIEGTTVLSATTYGALINAANGFRIGAVAVSPSYGAGRTIAIGLRNSIDALTKGYLFTMEAGAVMPGWKDQQFDTVPTFSGDVLALHFSPSYSGDAAYFVLSQATDTLGDDGAGLYLHSGFRNVRQNLTMNWDSAIGPHWIGFPREIAVVAGDSPGTDAEVVSADLDLPSDFNGDDARLRKFFVSYDAPMARAFSNIDVADVYRLDNTTIYRLNVPAWIDQANFNDKRISSIAYYGTSTQGKLLAGAVLGNQCSATVDVWYTLDPLACPAPCWQTSWKPPTGGAATDCNATYSWGNAQVAWSPDGKRGYTGTGWAAMIAPTAGPTSPWPGALAVGAALDESAFSITRNDGITWSQISLIDTEITKYTDSAPALDCTKLYLTSINMNHQCYGFDSIWMSPNADFKGTQVGTTWERILARRTTETCAATDGNHAILRLAPDKTDGSVVFWAAGGSEPDPGAGNRELIMWSEDGGDIWYYIRPTGSSQGMDVQDMMPESSSILYVLNRNAQVLKMVYARPNWKNADTSIYPSDSCLNVGKSIDAIPDGQVIVGSGYDGTGGTNKVSYSSDGGKTWTQTQSGTPGGQAELHVRFDPRFKDNKMFFAGATVYSGTTPTDADYGSLFRWTWGISTLWDDILTYTTSSSITGRGIGGIAIDSAGVLYAASINDHVPNATNPENDLWNSAVLRTTNGARGWPKPGLSWSTLNYNLPAQVAFTLEPQNVKLCGCLPNMKDNTLFVIDNYKRFKSYYENENTLGHHGVYYDSQKRGYVWVFVDCLAKVKPELIAPDLVTCDPVTGRAGQIDLAWQQPCLSEFYQIMISKDADGYYEIWKSKDFAPTDLLNPRFVIPAGQKLNYEPYTILAGGSLETDNQTMQVPLECGHEYYVSVKTTYARTGQKISTSASTAKKIIIKAGLPVTNPYIGPLSLTPVNGAAGVPTKPVNFNWSSYLEMTKVGAADTPSTEYQFQLSKANDPTMTSPLVDAKVKTAAYSYATALDYSANYFWRVRASSPYPSDWSPVFSFMTEKAPPPPPPPAPPPPPPPPTPAYVWVIIAIGALLVIVVLILIVRTRRA